MYCRSVVLNATNGMYNPNVPSEIRCVRKFFTILSTSTYCAAFNTNFPQIRVTHITTLVTLITLIIQIVNEFEF